MARSRAGIRRSIAAESLIGGAVVPRVMAGLAVVMSVGLAGLTTVCSAAPPLIAGRAVVGVAAVAGDQL